MPCERVTQDNMFCGEVSLKVSGSNWRINKFLEVYSIQMTQALADTEMVLVITLEA